MALDRLLSNVSAPAEGVLTSSIYTFLDGVPRQLFVSGIADAIVTVQLSPDNAVTWFTVASLTTSKAIQLQAQAGVQLRLTVARDQAALVNAWI